MSWGHFHWQNLNEDVRGNPKGWPIHGRAWLHLGRTVLRVEWNLASRSCGLELDVDPREYEVMVSARFPPLALYLGASFLPGLGWLWKRIRPKWDPRSIGIRIFDWAIWWSLWEDTHQSSSRDPWWMRGCWHPGRTFFGPWVYETRVLERRTIEVPMPEGSYCGTAELRYAVRGHKWSPLKHRTHEVEIDLVRGIPVPGKGENSWDCEDTAIQGHSGPARSIEHGVSNLVRSALETRRKYGGAQWRPQAEVAR